MEWDYIFWNFYDSAKIWDADAAWDTASSAFNAYKNYDLKPANLEDLGEFKEVHRILSDLGANVRGVEAGYEALNEIVNDQDGGTNSDFYVISWPKTEYCRANEWLIPKDLQADAIHDYLNSLSTSTYGVGVDLDFWDTYGDEDSLLRQLCENVKWSDYATEGEKVRFMGKPMSNSTGSEVQQQYRMTKILTERLESENIGPDVDMLLLNRVLMGERDHLNPQNDSLKELMNKYQKLQDVDYIQAIEDENAQTEIIQKLSDTIYNNPDIPEERLIELYETDYIQAIEDENYQTEIIQKLIKKIDKNQDITEEKKDLLIERFQNNNSRLEDIQEMEKMIQETLTNPGYDYETARAVVERRTLEGRLTDNFDTFLEKKLQADDGGEYDVWLKRFLNRKGTQDTIGVQKKDNFDFLKDDFEFALEYKESELGKFVDNFDVDLDLTDVTFLKEEGMDLGSAWDWTLDYNTVFDGFTDWTWNLDAFADWTDGAMDTINGLGESLVDTLQEYAACVAGR